jgi:hypothetical protein
MFSFKSVLKKCFLKLFYQLHCNFYLKKLSYQFRCNSHVGAIFLFFDFYFQLNLFSSAAATRGYMLSPKMSCIRMYPVKSV